MRVAFSISSTVKIDGLSKPVKLAGAKNNYSNLWGGYRTCRPITRFGDLVFSLKGQRQ